jgi:outer membrane protein TolC
MQGRRVFFPPALLLSTALAWAQQSPTVIASVDDLVRAGTQDNRDLASARARIDEARGQVRQAGVRPAATLDLTGQLESHSGPLARINMAQRFPRLF